MSSGAIPYTAYQATNSHDYGSYAYGQVNAFNRVPDETWWTKDRDMTAADLGLGEPSYTFWLGKEAA